MTDTVNTYIHYFLPFQFYFPTFVELASNDYLKDNLIIISLPLYLHRHFCNKESISIKWKRIWYGWENRGISL